MKSLKILLIGLLSLAFFFLLPQSSLAANFSTDYNVTYQVQDDASTRVTFDIALTNNTTQFYASSYTLILGFSSIDKISAKDSSGQIAPEVNQAKEGTRITVLFNNKVVGLGDKQNLSISFNTNEIAQRSGNVWEVNIPGISEQNDFSSFNVRVIPPKSAQKLLFIKPQVSVTNNSNIITFNQNQLGNSGISISYGDYQVYKFDLNYHLKNENLFPVKTEISLPPSTNYQDVQISDISPLPQNVKKDKDGNWLAEFALSPMEEQDVSVKGYSKLYLEPKKEELSEEQKILYTRPTKYWEADNVEIKKLSKTLKTPRQIYDYVSSKLTYDFTRVQGEQVRLGAAKVLKNSESAVCLEFTDLFIALSRAAGIPARAVEGYANTQNSRERPLSLVEDILHAWPEYYDFDKKSWVMVDPTWTNTTKGVDYFNILDLDHFVFVIKGIDSEYPIPAGGYKQKGQEKIKDVNVVALSSFPPPKENLVSEFDISSSQVSFLPIKGDIVVRNVGTFPSEPKVAYLKSGLSPNQIILNIPTLLPYETTKVPFELRSKKIHLVASEDLKLETPNQVVVKSIKISLFPLAWLIYLGGGILAVVFVFILSVVAYRSWRLYVLKRAEGSYLRGQSPKH